MCGAPYPCARRTVPLTRGVPGGCTLQPGQLLTGAAAPNLLAGCGLQRWALSLRVMRRQLLRNCGLSAWLAPRALLVLTLVACSPQSSRSEAHLIVEFPSRQSASDVALEPRRLALRARLVGSQLIVTVLPRQNAQLTVSAPATCPVRVDLTQLEAGDTLHHVARPWIDLGPPRADLGPGSSVRIEASPGCPEAAAGRIEWTQVEGKLEAFRTERRGFVVSGTLPAIDDLFARALPEGLVAVSPNQQGRVVLEARFTHGTVQQSARLELSALSRSRGLPNVPIGSSVLLGGNGWQLVEPTGSEAGVLQNYQGYSLLRPQSEARWLLRGPDDAELSLRSAAYDQVPLDCTRAACHENLREHTPGRMGDVLARGLNGQLGPKYTPSCALGCHAVGEPGVADGGFHHVASTLGIDVDQVTSYSALPAALQRLSNVGCLSCHGPGAIPEPAARHRILRSAVCAYCHDAPPRYGHVAAWQTSAMSQTSRRVTDPTREGCASCHTTAGFLETQAAAEAHPVAKLPERPEPVAPAHGLDCVVCHDVHQREPTRALLRTPNPPPSAEHLDAGSFATSRPCLNCHAPRAAPSTGPHAWPEASAASLWLGRGGFSRTGEPLTGPAVHAAAPEGCSTCHVGTASGLDRGKSHGFQPSAAACKSCHERPPTAPEHVSKARALLAEIARREPRLQNLALPAGTRPHTLAGELDMSTRLGRAAYNLLLLLEDPAAGIHNPDYTKLLLDHSEGMLRSSDEPGSAGDE